MATRVLRSSVPGSSLTSNLPSHHLRPTEIQLWRQGVQRDWKQLAKAPAALTADPVLVMEACVQNYRALQFASTEIRGNRDFVLQVIRTCGAQALQFGTDLVRGDREVVWEAVSRDPTTLKYAFYRHLKADKELAMLAVQKNWRQLEIVMPELQADKELCMVAVQQDWRAIQHMDEALHRDKDIMKIAVEQSGEALRYCGEALRLDPDLVALAQRRGAEVVCDGETKSIKLLYHEIIRWPARAPLNG